MLELNKVVVPDSTVRTVTVEFTTGVNVTVRYLSNIALQGLVERATIYRARKGKGRAPEVDVNRLATELSAYVTDWDGMKLRALTSFLVLKEDITAAELDEEIVYSREQAVELLKYINEFSQLVQETATSPELFHTINLEDKLGNLPTTSSGSSPTTVKSSPLATAASKPSKS